MFECIQASDKICACLIVDVCCYMEISVFPQTVFPPSPLPSELADKVMGEYKRAFAEIFEQANERLQSVGGCWMLGGGSIFFITPLSPGEPVK